MSDYEHHRGKLKRVDLSKFDNSKEKYFEARYRYEFGANEEHPYGLTEKEIQEAYLRSVNQVYRRRDPWENLWFKNDVGAVLLMGDDIWEVADIELDDNKDVFTKVSNDEYEYYTSFHNGACGLEEALEYGLEEALKKDKS